MIQRYELFYGMFFLLTFFSWKMVKEKYGWIPFLLLTFVLADAAYVFYWPGLTIDTLSLRLRLVSARSFAIICMNVFLMTQLGPWHIKRALQIFEIMIQVECALYLYFGYAFFNAGSADMAFIAMAYPMMLFRRKITWERSLVLILPIVCLFYQIPGSTVFFALALGIGSYLLLKKKWKYVVPVIVGCVAFGYYRTTLSGASGGSLLWYVDRVEPWKLIMNWWVEWANMWTGTGTGTFQWLGPTIQNKETDLFIFMHNEYLQIIFEQGLIGFALVLTLVYTCLRKAWSTPWLFASCISTLFVFCVQFPLRYLPSQIFVLLLVRLCLDRESKNFVEFP